MSLPSLVKIVLWKWCDWVRGWDRRKWEGCTWMITWDDLILFLFVAQRVRCSTSRTRTWYPKVRSDIHLSSFNKLVQCGATMISILVCLNCWIFQLQSCRSYGVLFFPAVPRGYLTGANNCKCQTHYYLDGLQQVCLTEICRPSSHWCVPHYPYSELWCIHVVNCFSIENGKNDKDRRHSRGEHLLRIVEK